MFIYSVIHYILISTALKNKMTTKWRIKFILNLYCKAFVSRKIFTFSGAVYALAANLYEEEIECPMGLCESDRMVVGDKYVGAFLTICPEYCFVAENMSDGTIIAFVLTTPDAIQFYR